MALSPSTSHGGSSSGAEMTYVEYTSDVNITATVEASADTIVTGAAFNADGTSAYLIEFFASSVVTSNVAGRNCTIIVFEDGSSIGKVGIVQTVAASNLVVPVRVARRRVAASGSRTYSIRAIVNAGTSIASAGLGGAGNAMPGFIRVTKVT